MRKFKKINRA